MNTVPVFIAGGGIAGLASALAVRSRDAIILEAASSFSDIGAGLQLGPNAVRALQKLGAWDAVEPLTSSPPEIHMRDGLSGKLIKRLPLGAGFKKRHGMHYHTAYRADLHAALLNVVNSKSTIDVRLNERILRVDVNPDDISLQVNSQTLSCHALIAADGVKSIVRQNLFEGSAAHDSALTHHRALVPIPTLADVDMECVNLWMYPRGHVVHYPVGIRQRLNIVAITPKGFQPSDHFIKAAASLKKILALADATFTAWPGLYAPSLPSWTKGGVLLIGDAAHGTLPFLAQGAAMALEDAACLADVMTNTANLHHAFAETASRRMARTLRLHTETLRAGRVYHLSGPLRLARNTTLATVPGGYLARQLDWLYNG